MSFWSNIVNLLSSYKKKVPQLTGPTSDFNLGPQSEVNSKSLQHLLEQIAHKSSGSSLENELLSSLRMRRPTEILFSMATRIFGSKQIAENWMKEKSLALGLKSPAELMKTHEGFVKLFAELVRIEAGVL